jgi:NaMN:DMB phosphoribosyltransferase
MLAVFALIDALTRHKPQGTRSHHLPVVATTKWVAFDPGARSAELASLLSAPYVAACPDFTHSIHPGLQAYEEGNVKEGVGAGAAMLLAHIAGNFTESQIVDAIDGTYIELVDKPAGELTHSSLVSASH